MTQPNHDTRAGDAQTHTSLAVLVSILLLMAAYQMLRYAGHWGEVDAANALAAIRAMWDAGRLVPSTGPVYPNGYAYQALVMALSAVSGISIEHFQFYGSLLLMSWVVLPAWLLYRELTDSPAGATLATVILLVQPEFLFPLLRGTHEKFTRGLILLALYLFVRSLRTHQSPVRLSGFVLAFYLTVYAIISFNNLMAFSFVAALILSLGLMAVLGWWSQGTNKGLAQASKRLSYAAIVSLVVSFLFTFFLYRPAQHDILVMQGLVDQLASLFLNVEQDITNPYTLWITGGWISPGVYRIISLANWLLLIVSIVVWARMSLDLLRFGPRDWAMDRLILWSLYSVFAFQAALSILVDLSGGLASNLQHRIFPSFAMLAAPLVARAVIEHQWFARRHRLLALVPIAASLVFLATVSVLKATNEPLVSNKWLYHTPAEMNALDRAQTILADRRLWSEFDERLSAGYRLRDRPLSVLLESGQYPRSPMTRSILVSDVTRARGFRMAMDPPVEGDSLVTFDNGQAQIYRLRPRTPYQR